MNNILIAHDLRSCYNVGSLLRTCDGLGVDMIMTGTTPFPLAQDDPRLPHIAQRAHNQITKTALGAETSVNWRHHRSIHEIITSLTEQGYTVAALEQTDKAVNLPHSIDGKWALVVGHEVNGVDQQTLEAIGTHLQIPMAGQKQSLNVTIAAAIALWSLNQK